MARRKRFSAEFKRQALRRANEPGMTDTLIMLVVGSCLYLMLEDVRALIRRK